MLPPQNDVGEAGFGRGDHDGFPALSTDQANLSSATVSRILQASFPALPSTRTSAVASPTRELSVDTRSKHPRSRPRSPTELNPVRVEGMPSRSAHKSRVHMNSDLNASLRGMQADISVIMRKRALKGYGLGQVCCIPLKPLASADVLGLTQLLNVAKKRSLSR